MAEMKKGIADLIREANAESPIPVRVNAPRIVNPRKAEIDKAAPSFRYFDELNPYRTLADFKDVDELMSRAKDRYYDKNLGWDSYKDTKVEDLYNFLANNKEYLNSVIKFDRQFDKDLLDFEKSPEYKRELLKSAIATGDTTRGNWNKLMKQRFNDKYGYALGDDYEWNMPMEKWNIDGRDLSDEEYNELKKANPKGYVSRRTWLPHDEQTLDKNSVISRMTSEDLRDFINYVLANQRRML